MTWQVHPNNDPFLSAKLHHGMTAYFTVEPQAPFLPNSLVCPVCDEGAITLEQVLEHALATGHIMIERN